MGLFDKIKKAFSKEAEPVVESQEQTLAQQFAGSSTIEPYVHSLRAEWLNDRSKQPVAVQLIESAAQRFPQHEALIRILRGIYVLDKPDAADVTLFDYATSLMQTTNFAFEGCLYRARVLFESGKGRQAISSIIRAGGSDRLEGDFLRWYLAQLLRNCTSSLYQKAEKDLGPDDGAVALMLAYVTVQASSRLMTEDWKKRIDAFQPPCGARVSEELVWTVTVRAELLEKAQEYSLKTSLNPGFIARTRAVAGLPQVGDVAAQIVDAVVRARTRDTTQMTFKRLEGDAHRKHLAQLPARLERLRSGYDGCLGLIELEAEDASRAGKLQDAVKKFEDLLRRRPHQTYYAYRAAQLLEQDERTKEAGPFWVHAARTLGNGWRSKLSSIVASAHTYERESASLRAAPGAAVAPAARALAVYLEERMNESWDLGYWTAAYALGVRAAQLNHLAASQSREPSEREKLRAKATELYSATDDLDGLKLIHNAPSSAVYEPIAIPLTANPV